MVLRAEFLSCDYHDPAPVQMIFSFSTDRLERLTAIQEPSEVISRILRLQRESGPPFILSCAALIPEVTMSDMAGVPRAA
jgi:hypothetical protein